MHSAPTLRSSPSCQEPRGKCRRPCTHPTHPAPTGVFIWKIALVLTCFTSDFRSACLTLHPSLVQRLFVFECHSTNVCHSCTRAGQSQQAAHGFTGSVRRRVRSDSNNHRRRATKCDTRRPPSALDPHEQNQPSKV